MAPDDDERGIDWLASQLGQADDAAGTGVAPAAETPPAKSADAAVPAPASPAPWWTTPLAQPVETDVTSIAVEPTALLPVSEAPAESEAPSRHRSRTGTPGTTQAAVIWTAVGLLALVVLVGLFYLGQRLVAGPVLVAAPTASAEPTPTPTSTPTPTPEVTSAQPAGVHEWNTLFGGECLEPYVSPWEEDFTVVDCAAGHTAQLVYRGNFGGDAATVYPGEAALAAQINLLCTAPGILDLNTAGAYPNLQMQGSYPITAEQWTAEPRTYHCFVSRASAEPLTGSIMGAGPTA